MADVLHKRPQADADLDSIWLFIAPDNIAAADKLLDRIGQVFQLLLNHPHAGRARPELSAELRSFPVGNYIVFYIPTSTRIEIVRVMNANQEITAEDMM